MALLEPLDKDVEKIHSEVNQLVNQRFILCTLAITIFCVFVAWLIPRNVPKAQSTVGGFVYIVSILLSLMIFTIGLLHNLLKGMMRVFTSYLVVTEKSAWEIDWERYRKDPYFGYSKAQTIVFLVLNIFAVLFPFIFAIVYSQSLEPTEGLVAMLIVGTVVEISLYGMGFKGWGDIEHKAASKWKSM